MSEHSDRIVGLGPDARLLVNRLREQRGWDWRKAMSDYYEGGTTAVDRLASLLVDCRAAGIDVEHAIADSLQQILAFRGVVPTGHEYHKARQKENRP